MRSSQRARGDSDRNEQVERVLKILNDLDRRAGGVDLYTLADEHGVTTRTVRRDLEALERAGIRFERRPDPQGKRLLWCIDRKTRSDHQRILSLLDASHYLALRVAMQAAGARPDASWVAATLEDVADKIETAIGKTGRQRLQAIDNCFQDSFKGSFEQAPPSRFWPLVEAIVERRVCLVTYRAPREKAVDKSFDVFPLRLRAHQGAMYLLAYVPKHRNYILLHLHRLRGLKLRRKTFAIPKSFDPDAFENLAFGVFAGDRALKHRLRFAAHLAPFIRERCWHPTQRLRETARGTVELEFQCSPSPEVTAWVSGWGSGVEVLEPKELRRELRELGVWLQATYTNAKSTALPERAARSGRTRRAPRTRSRASKPRSATS